MLRLVIRQALLRPIPKETSARFACWKNGRLLLAPALTPSPPAKEPGKTTVSWDTADGSIGKVFVSINGGQEVLFADGRCGSAPAHWIETGSNYEFRLYNSDHTELLAKVAVTRTMQ